MKIMDLLPTTISYLNELVKDDTHPINVNWEKIADLEHIYVLDAEITLRKLKYLISTSSAKEATPESLKPLQEFLVERWEYVRQTDLSYPSNMSSLTNQTCWVLANEISNIINLSAYQLLMPTVTHTVNEITGSEWKNLQLSEFVLSDDDTRFIEVIECLQCAEEDCILKHTSLFEGVHAANMAQGVKPLSAAEASRVISHSHETTQYFSAIKNMFEIKNRGMTVGAFVTRLAYQLVAGGVNPTDRNANHNVTIGPAAIAGIQEFNNFLKILTPQERDALYGSTAPNLTMGRNFMVIWYRILSRAVIDRMIDLPEPELQAIINHLAQFEFVDEPCILLLAININSILANNQNLFTITPSNAQSSQMGNNIFQNYAVSRNNTKDKLKQISKNFLLQSRELYGGRGDLRLVERMLAKLIEQNSNEVIISSLPANYLETVLKSLDSAHLGMLIKNAINLLSILFKLPAHVAKDFLWKQLGDKNLKIIFPNSIEFRLVLQNLNLENKKSLIEACSAEHLRLMMQIFLDINPVVEVLDAEQTQFLLSKLGRESLRGMIRNINDLKKVLTHHVNLRSMLDLLGKEHIQQMTKQSYQLKELLTVFVSSDVDLLIDFLGKEHLCQALNSFANLQILQTLSDPMQVKLLESVFDAEYYKRHITIGSDLLTIMRSINQHNQEKLLCRMDQRHLQKLISSWYILSQMLNSLLPSNQANLLYRYLSREHLQSIIDESVIDNARNHSKETFQNICFSVGPMHIAKMTNSLITLGAVLSLLSDTQQDEFISHCFSPEKIDQLIKNHFELNYVMQSFSKTAIKKILFKLSEEKVYQLIDSVDMLASAISRYEKQEQENFLSQFRYEKVWKLLYIQTHLAKLLKNIHEDNRIKIIETCEPKKLQRMFQQAVFLPELLELLPSAAQIIFLDKLGGQKLNDLLIGNQMFYYGLKNIDPYTRNAKVFSALLLGLAKAYLVHLDKTMPHDQVYFSIKLATEELIQVMEGKKNSECLREYASQLSQGDLFFIHKRYLGIATIAPLQNILIDPMRTARPNPSMLFTRPTAALSVPVMQNSGVFKI